MRKITSVIIFFAVLMSVFLAGCDMSGRLNPEISLEIDGNTLHMVFDGIRAQRAFNVLTPEEEGIEVDYELIYDSWYQEIDAEFNLSGNYYFVIIQGHHTTGTVEKIYIYCLTVDDDLNGQIECIREDEFGPFEFNSVEFTTSLVNDYGFDFDRIVDHLYGDEVNLDSYINDLINSDEYITWDYEKYFENIPPYEELPDNNVVRYMMTIFDEPEELEYAKRYFLVKELENRGYISHLYFCERFSCYFIDEKGQYRHGTVFGVLED